jgi:hypothetical protein
MKMIQDSKIKIYKKICSKLPLIPSWNGFCGSVKITGIRKYQRWNTGSYPWYEDLYNYHFDVEVHGKIRATYKGNELLWWGSEIQKDEEFSSRMFNNILRERFLKKDLQLRAKLLGMDVDDWNVKIVKIKWV